MGRTSTNFSSFLIRHRLAQPHYRWPCRHRPKTLSFRNTTAAANATSTSGFADDGEFDSPGGDGEQSVETVIQRVKSVTGDRLLFEPGETRYFSVYSTTPIAIGAEQKNAALLTGAAVALTMDSEDPLLDFRRSMEEMVEAHHLHRSWVCLDDLLGFYLRANGKNNHGYILAAFVDLLLALSYSSSPSPSSSSSSCSPSPALTSSSCSYLTTPCLTSSSLETEEGEKEQDNASCC